MRGENQTAIINLGVLHLSIGCDGEGFDSEQLWSLNRRRKMRPAGTTLHAKDNLPDR